MITKTFSPKALIHCSGLNKGFSFLKSQHCEEQLSINKNSINFTSRGLVVVTDLD